MNEIIKISYDSEQPTVLGRDLHKALEVQTPYDKWFPRMCEYGFEINKDYSTFLSEARQVSQEQTTNSQSLWQKKYVCFNALKKVRCSDSIL